MKHKKTFLIMALFIFGIFTKEVYADNQKLGKTLSMITGEIKPITSDHIKDVRELIMRVIFELQIVPSTSLEALSADHVQNGQFNDLDNLQSIYFANNGTFLVMLANDMVVGMGAIKKIDDEMCELKRMYFAKDYRGIGLGKKMAETLLDHARKVGYKKIRLIVYNPAVQSSAIAFYKKLGFYEIPPYKQNVPIKFFAEKVL